MTEKRNTRHFDLEERTLVFAKRCREFIKLLSKTLTNIEDCSQLTKSSGSVGANYIEANEALSKKDFLYRIKICRKEAKESRCFLKLVDMGEDNTLEKENAGLIQEATELMKIFGAIITKSGE